MTLSGCTTPNPNYRPTHNDAAEDSTLGRLSVAPGTLTPSFDSGTMMYSVSVGSGVGEVAITAAPRAHQASLTVNGQEADSDQTRTISLNDPGLSTPIPLVVTTPSGGKSTYVVTVNRASLAGNDKLQSLSISPGALDPGFDSNTTTYSANVPGGVSVVAVTAALQDTNATVTINGTATNPGQERAISLNGPGLSTPIAVAVTAPNGNQKTYMVNVNRAALSGNNALRRLTVASVATFQPPFSASIANYSANIFPDVNSIVVAIQPDDPAATVTINSQVSTVLTVELAGAVTSTISIQVTAQNGNTRTYSVTVNRYHT